MEGRAFHARLITPDTLPPGLQLDHDLSLDAGKLDVMAPVLTPALLSRLASNIEGLEKPVASTLSAASEAKGSVKGLKGGCSMSRAPGPSHEGGLALQVLGSVDDVVKYEAYSQETSQQDSPIPNVNPEDIAPCGRANSPQEAWSG